MPKRFGPELSDDDKDIAVGLEKERVSYRMIEDFTHLKPAHGMDALRVCNARKLEMRHSYAKATRAANKATKGLAGLLFPGTSPLAGLFPEILALPPALPPADSEGV